MKVFSFPVPGRYESQKLFYTHYYTGHKECSSISCNQCWFICPNWWRKIKEQSFEIYMQKINFCNLCSNTHTVDHCTICMIPKQHLVCIFVLVIFAIFTSLAKEVMFLVALVSLSVCLSVCLFVCLSVDNITQKVMNGLGWNFMDGSWVIQGRTD